ncbi:Phosphoribosylanthranilate isomerase [Planctomycetales bacterium 10988]|nr:Phosphoribosylanthranilate isomerase [Planctomycetales bacterium 10988]
MTRMFQTKICGITSVEDALAARDSGVEAIGLNFYPPSPRSIASELAAEISRALAEPATSRSPQIVGVFVNEPLESLLLIAKQAGLDYLQLHGDETPEYLQSLQQQTSLPLIKAFRWGKEGPAETEAFLKACQAKNIKLAAILIDAREEQAYGGTGKVADWSAVRSFKSEHPDLLVILAGGLKPENVARAIEQTGADAVDTASGVESSPGKKSPEKMRQFVAAAQFPFMKEP